MKAGFGHEVDSDAKATKARLSSASIPRPLYAARYGPTTGDRLRLADTSLVLEVDRDLTTIGNSAGDECTFGGGKTIREGMGQAANVGAAEALDLLIAGAVCFLICVVVLRCV